MRGSPAVLVMRPAVELSTVTFGLAQFYVIEKVEGFDAQLDARRPEWRRRIRQKHYLKAGRRRPSVLAQQAPPSARSPMQSTQSGEVLCLLCKRGPTAILLLDL